MPDSYRNPLDRLMKLGAEPARRRVWPDYRHLGLTDRHVPALIGIATDPALHTGAERDRAVWAPIHAWRALAQLEAAAAVGPLASLLEREIGNPWVYDELPIVLGILGPPALHGATLLLFDEEKPPLLRFAAAHTIVEVAHEHPERRDEAVAILAKQLEDHAYQAPDLNAMLVADLVSLEAKEAAPVIEAAFAAGAVDVSVNGDWEDVQIALGLLDERITPPTPWSPLGEDEYDAAPPPDRPRSPNADTKARKRQKAAKASRKRNRKRK